MNFNRVVRQPLNFCSHLGQRMSEQYQSSKKKRWRWVIGTVLVLIAAYKGVFYFSDTRFYKGMVPAKIQVAGRYYIGGKTDIWSGGCGIAAFTLSDSTVEQIKRQGLSFFSDARFGLGKRLIGEDAKSEYKEWEETPIDPESFSNGILPGGFECAPNAGHRWLSEIRKSLEDKGSYWTINQHSGVLYVIPNMKLVIFAYED